MTAASLIEHRDDIAAFTHSLARSLRWWLAALPAGIGMATAKAILRLWLGISPQQSGVSSAGNGPAMRSAVIGVVFAADACKRRDFTLASCHITHTDKRAEEAVLLVAEAAAAAVRGDATEQIVEVLNELISSTEMQSCWGQLRLLLPQQASVHEYTKAICCEQGVSGFAPITIAVALYAWLRHRGDFKTAMIEVIHCGGDADTVAAILGGIAGTEAGDTDIPSEWLDGVWDWPRSLSYLQRLSQAFGGTKAPRYFWPAVPIRNLLFLAVVISHGFRRLLPPY